MRSMRPAVIALSLATLSAAGCTTATRPSSTAGGPATTAPVAPAPATSPNRPPASAPAGQRLTFRGVTIRLRPGWTATRADDQVQVTTDRKRCRRDRTGITCPGFVLLGPGQIAHADEGSPYRPDRVYHPGSGVQGCPFDRDHAAETTPATPRTATTAPIGRKTALYREWAIHCVAANDPARGAGQYTQRDWYLPASQVLVVDESSTPGLGAILAAAS